MCEENIIFLELVFFRKKVEQPLKYILQGFLKEFKSKNIKKFSKLLILCSDVLNTGIQDTVENKRVFDPDWANH